MTERKLGETFTRDGVEWRVIRIAKQISLFQDETCEIVEEHLIELKSEKGQIDFEVLASNRSVYQGPPSPIKPPKTIKWRLPE